MYTLVFIVALTQQHKVSLHNIEGYSSLNECQKAGIHLIHDKELAPMSPTFSCIHKTQKVST
jgi:hypothetical protein